jgi:phosphoglycolate phosphatase-like HAD superfamily hydrolase
VEKVIGRAAEQYLVPMSGKTDPLIARQMLERAGVDGDADALVPEVIGHLEEALGSPAGADALRDGGVVLPGVPQILRRLHEDSGVLQSVLTGNTAANAKAKLAAFELDQWIDVEVGAFGSDNPARNALVPVALERVARLRGRTFDPAEVWVVGDTPFDLECARAGGARCALVGTGRMGFDALVDIGADAVLPDLSDVDAVVTLLAAPT